MEIILNLICIFLRIADIITGPYFNYKAKGKKQILPPIKSDLVRISATELARRIRRKQVSSEEVCKAYIKRIKDVNPVLNAIVEERFSKAVKEAKNVDEYLLKTSLSERELEKIKPLLGVPITIKESCSVKGMSFCTGTISRVGYKAETDGEAVSRIMSCGAIVLLVSNIPELCCGWETRNLVTGQTNNPYDTTCTAGGSSGGEAALLGAGASLIGIGSDFAGSIRMPAALNGIFGHKPTAKLVPIKGHFPFSSDERFSEALVIGPMGRYATDLKLLLKVLVGNRMSNELGLDESVSLSQLNVYWMEDFGFRLSTHVVDKDVQSSVRKAVRHLTKVCGAKAQEYKFEEFKYGLDTCGTYVGAVKDIPNPLKWENAYWFIEVIKLMFGKSRFSANVLHMNFLRYVCSNIASDHTAEIIEMKKSVIEILGTKGILVIPSWIGSAFKHKQFVFKNGFPYMSIANALGLPATNVPCGFDRNGMPIGIQVMAAPNQDRLCLMVAEELEKCFGGWVPPPEA